MELPWPLFLLLELMDNVRDEIKPHMKQLHEV
jgi:hypothetical protein